jgi:hypothetical protein
MALSTATEYLGDDQDEMFPSYCCFCCGMMDARRGEVLRTLGYPSVTPPLDIALLLRHCNQSLANSYFFPRMATFDNDDEVLVV